MIDYDGLWWIWHTQKIHFRTLTEFRNVYSILKCATATKWLHKHNLSCLFETPLAKQDLYGPREQESGRGHYMQQVDQRNYKQPLHIFLPSFRFNIPSLTKIIIALRSKVQVCFESTKQHHRLLRGKPTYTMIQYLKLLGRHTCTVPVHVLCRLRVTIHNT